MPYTVESPRPVPTPGPLVVKKGSNTWLTHYLGRHAGTRVGHGDADVTPGVEVGMGCGGVLVDHLL